MANKVGHRARLKEKFMALDELSNKMPDYELLELILFLSIPRCDTNSLAKELLKEFKTINNIIYADKERLLKVKGIGRNTVMLFKLLQSIFKNILTDSISDKELLNSTTKVLEYAKITMGNLNFETLKVLFLDTKNKLISDETLQRGTIDQTPVYVREIIKRALDLGATSIIVLHNHPSGDPTPSDNDVMITRQLKDACDRLSIRLHDHLIISRYTHRSLKSMGLI